MKTKELEPKFVALTLKWCNRIRELKGKKPLRRLPKGETYNPFSCPCGKATGICVRTHKHDWEDGKMKANPKSVTQFIVAFDDGQLPQYEL